MVICGILWYFVVSYLGSRKMPFFYCDNCSNYSNFALAFEKFRVFEIIKTKRVESDFRESKLFLIRFFRNED